MGATAPSAEGSLLGPGDIFSVRVYGEDELSGEFMVGRDGNIVYPFVGVLQVAGLSPNGVSAAIRSSLANGYLRDPQVTVFLKELNSKKVHVAGQVQEPGTFKYANRMTIVEAVTLAGGLTKLAWARQVRLTRRVGGQERQYVVALDHILEGRGANVELQAGDIIYVPESLF